MQTKDLTQRKPGIVYSVDASQWDFSQQYAKLGVHHGNYLHPDDHTDVYLTKDNIDFRHLSDTSLFSVGGYIHWHDTDGSGIYIVDGFVTQKRLKTNHIGIISFEELNCPVVIEKIDSDNIYPSDVKEEVWNSVYIKKTTGQFEDNDVIGLVLCGELYWLGLDGDVIDYVNHNVLKVNLHKWHLFEKVYKYKGIFGKEANMGLTPYLDNRINVDEVKSFDFIKSLFTLSQTFLVIVKATSPIKMGYKTATSHQLPNRYIVGTHHYEPLRAKDGRYLPYTPYDDRNGYVLRTEPNRIYPQINDNLIRSQQPYLNELNVSSARGRIIEAQFLQMTY